MPPAASGADNGAPEVRWQWRRRKSSLQAVDRKFAGRARAARKREASSSAPAQRPATTLAAADDAERPAAPVDDVERQAELPVPAGRTETAPFEWPARKIHILLKYR